MCKDNTVNAVRQELDAAGVKYTLGLEGRSNHFKARIEHNGQKRLYVLPHSSKDTRSIMNNRCGIRRILRELGAIK